MTSLEDLLESEKGAVNPSQAELDRLERRVGAALGVGLGAFATTTSLAASAKGASALTKLWATLFANPIWLWGAGTLAGAGLGYAVALGTSTDEPEANLSDSTKLVAAPASRAPQPAEPEPEQQAVPPAAPFDQPVVQPPVEQEPKDAAARVQAPRSPSPADRLKQDARLLSEVSAALNRGAPHEALRLLDSTSLKGSPLSTEFSAARAIAWCQLGLHTRAKSTVASLKKYAPDSPALLRVRQACEGE